MNEVLKVNSKELDSRLSAVDKHILTVVAIAFSAAIVYLFIAFSKLNDQFIEYIQTDSRKQIEVIERNTNTMNRVEQFLIRNNNR